MLIVFFIFLVFYVYIGTKKQQSYKSLEDGAKSIEDSLVELSSGFTMIFMHLIMILLIPIFYNNLIIPIVIGIIATKMFFDKKFAYHLISNYSRIINNSNDKNNDTFIYIMKLKAFTIGVFLLISLFSFYMTNNFIETDSEKLLGLISFFIMLTIPVIARAFIPIFEIIRYCNKTYDILIKKENK
jgi:hypothetical protein